MLCVLGVGKEVAVVESEVSDRVKRVGIMEAVCF